MNTIFNVFVFLFVCVNKIFFVHLYCLLKFPAYSVILSFYEKELYIILQ